MINREWMGDQVAALHWHHGIRETVPALVIVHWCRALNGFDQKQIEDAIVDYLSIPRTPGGTPWPGDIKIRIGAGCEVTPRRIVEWTAQIANVPIDLICSDNRQRRVSWPRQAGMSLSRQYTDASLPTIARAFGGRNHSSVLTASQRTDLRMKKPGYAEIHKAIEGVIVANQRAA